MTLPSSPPRYDPWRETLNPIMAGAEPWAVYALQRAIGVKPATGNFNPTTKRKLRDWQRSRGLTADGIAGPITQGVILSEASRAADKEHGLPAGTSYGFAVWEGGGVLAATNWSVPGGVDCGPAQWRIKGPSFAMDALKDAFRPYLALDHTAERIARKWREYQSENGHLRQDPPIALEVAVLYHHWQVGAERVVDKYPGGGSWWRYVPSPDNVAGPNEVWPPKGYTNATWSREYARRILSFTVGP